MKDKISKILGVALALALVVSVAGVALPADDAVAAAATNVWEAWNIPKDGATGNWVIADDGGNGTAGPIAQAIDGTLYCFASPSVASTTSFLFKSTDGGYKWAAVGDLDAAAMSGADIIVDIATSATDADVLYVTDGYDIWKSSDAGANFTKAGTITLGGGMINDIDCAEWSDGKYIVVAGVAGGTAEGVWIYDESETFPIWVDQAVGGVAAGNGIDARAVALSPDFTSDRQIVAVTSTLPTGSDDFTFSGGTADTFTFSGNGGTADVLTFSGNGGTADTFTFSGNGGTPDTVIFTGSATGSVSGTIALAGGGFGVVITNDADSDATIVGNVITLPDPTDQATLTAISNNTSGTLTIAGAGAGGETVAAGADADGDVSVTGPSPNYTFSMPDSGTVVATVNATSGSVSLTATGGATIVGNQVTMPGAGDGFIATAIANGTAGTISVVGGGLETVVAGTDADGDVTVGGATPNWTFGLPDSGTVVATVSTTTGSLSLAATGGATIVGNVVTMAGAGDGFTATATANNTTGTISVVGGGMETVIVTIDAEPDATVGGASPNWTFSLPDSGTVVATVNTTAGSVFITLINGATLTAPNEVTMAGATDGFTATATANNTTGTVTVVGGGMETMVVGVDADSDATVGGATPNWTFSLPDNSQVVGTIAVTTGTVSIAITTDADSDASVVGNVITLPDATDVATITATTNNTTGTLTTAGGGGETVAIGTDADTDAAIGGASPNWTFSLPDSAAETRVTTKIGGSGWNATVGDALITGITTTDADIAFPSDYDSDVAEGSYVQFIGISNGASNGDLYQILGVAAPGVSAAVDRNIGTDINGVAVSGPGTAAKILAGEMGDNVVHYSKNSGSTWETIYKQVTGTSKVNFVMDDDFENNGTAWATTYGDDGGVSLTTDYGITWNQIGLIDTIVAAIHDLATADSTVFLSTCASGGGHANDNIWKYDGTNWVRVLSSTLYATTWADLVAVSSDFATDNTVFVADLSDTVIYRSTNAGQTWKAQTTATPGTINAWAVVDANNLFVANGANVYKTTNNGLSWSSAYATGLSGVSSLVLSPNYDTDGTILAGNIAFGGVAMSTDEGETWETLPSTGSAVIAAGRVTPAFSPDFADDNTIYATSSGGGVYRYVVDDSSDWVRIDDLAGAPAADRDVDSGTGLVVSADGTLYATDSNAAGDGMSRCLNPTGSALDARFYPYFEEANDTTGGTIATILWGLWLTDDNTLWAAGSDGRLYRYEDALAVAVTPTSPANGSSSGRETSATVTWEALPRATSYDIGYDTAANFMMAGFTTQTSMVTAETLTGLTPGVTYYWHARVTAQSPVRSRWSTAMTFTTAIGQAQWNPFAIPGNVAPSSGATGVPVRPSFQWNAADWATGYEFELADNSAFDSPLVSTTTTATAYVYTSDLDFSTTYYWRVRAVNDSSSSEWAAGIFTTEAAPEEETEPTPAPTPAWVWAVVVLGAALIIAMLILIMRTRRAA